ncbi:biotin transporter BioY [Peptostreptococcus equinus]|uniref:Biotin transporter n=1 Tax=Peptostreptococcus equinus TaxID=3003601 RepID=A0ABY7JSE3_9FIRM|nr:biotin transporter BioY [Peptostreptococcus sp. CBA3647]WAW15389.1 biotin transporter BioY [Peptostreptococcus sp. CBA3647]
MEKTLTNINLDVKSMVLCSIFSALYVVGAFIQIPLPNSDYFTLQYLFIILSAMVLSPKKALLSVCIYLALGLAGFPVFAAGGGITYILKPSFGYLIGFAVSSYIVSYLLNNRNKKFSNFFMAGIVGFLIIYVIGFIYKYTALNLFMGVKTPWLVIFLGAFPIDMPGDLIATILAAILAPKIRRAVYADGR